MSQLVLDLGQSSILGLKIGDRFFSEKLELETLGKGYDLYFKDRKLTGFFVCFRDGYKGYGPFLGEVFWLGEKRKITEDTKDEQLKSMYASLPISDWNDGVERNLEFRVNGITHEYNWNSITGKLDYLLVEK